MIKGIHSMFYSTDANALRAFFRDKLGLPFTDVGGGWLIFDAAEAEVGVHPADEALGIMSGKNEISLYCDNIGKTMAQLEKKGVDFVGPATDMGDWGVATQMIVPGGFNIMLYEPKYKKGGSKPKPAAKKPMKAKAPAAKKKVKVVVKKKAKKKK